MSVLLSQARQWMQAHDEGRYHLYALMDGATDKRLWEKLGNALSAASPLISGPREITPQLISLNPSNGAEDVLIKRISHPKSPSTVTLLASPLSQSELATHLQHFVRVLLAGEIDMALAYWDPAILGTLVGQFDDETLHVKGPIFTDLQRAALLKPIPAWWYCDRENNCHRISFDDALPDTCLTQLPIRLTQEQEDGLVEAGVPDQILYHLELNRPLIFDEQIPHARRYRFVRAVLPSARMLGLTGMRDLTNFVALCLIYRQRMQTDSEILKLLDLVQRKELTLDDAMKQMPE